MGSRDGGCGRHVVEMIVQCMKIDDVLYRGKSVWSCIDRGNMYKIYIHTSIFNSSTGVSGSRARALFLTGLVRYSS